MKKPWYFVHAKLLYTEENMLYARRVYLTCLSLIQFKLLNYLQTARKLRELQCVIDILQVNFRIWRICRVGLHADCNQNKDTYSFKSLKLTHNSSSLNKGNQKHDEGLDMLS